jgi:hypothetical protein
VPSSCGRFGDFLLFFMQLRVDDFQIRSRWYKRFKGLVVLCYLIFYNHSPRPVLYPYRFTAQLEKNLHGMPSRKSNSGLPFRQPTHYQLSYAANIFRDYLLDIWTRYSKSIKSFLNMFILWDYLLKPSSAQIRNVFVKIISSHSTRRTKIIF